MEELKRTERQYMIKVPNGKLLKIKIAIEKQRIKSLQILGDFFLYPEEAIKDLENSLINKTQQQCLQTIMDIIEKKKIQLLGFSTQDLNDLITQGFNNEQ